MHHQKMKTGRTPWGLFSRSTPMTIASFRHRSSPAVLKFCSADYRQIFKIDAYDDRFLSSSVVPCGVEKFAGGVPSNFSRSNMEWESKR